MVDSVGRGFKDYAPLVLRIGIGIIFFLEGVHGVANAGAPETYIIPAIKLLAGLLVFVGFLTRYAAITLAVLMIVLIVKHHGWYVVTKPEHQLLFALLMMCFALFCLGGGRMSMDLRRQRQKSNET